MCAFVFFEVYKLLIINLNLNYKLMGNSVSECVSESYARRSHRKLSAKRTNFPLALPFARHNTYFRVSNLFVYDLISLSRP